MNNNSFLKTLLEKPKQKEVFEKEVKQESLNYLSEQKSQESSEKYFQAIETQMIMLDTQHAKLDLVLKTLSPEESEYIQKSFETNPESQKILQNIQEKIEQFVTAGHHAQEHLSEHYNPKVVRTVHSIGKALGGITGLFAGMPLGTVGSAAGAIAGSKAGGYGLLKLFEKTIDTFPQSIQEKIKNKELPQKELNQKQEYQEEIKKPEESLEAQRNKALEESRFISQEIQNLDPESKKKFIELIEKDSQVNEAIDTLENVYTKAHDFYHEFEVRFPKIATTAEFGIHTAIGIGLHASGLGTATVILMDTLAAAGGAEKITSKLITTGNAIKEKIGQIYKN